MDVVSGIEHYRYDLLLQKAQVDLKVVPTPPEEP